VQRGHARALGDVEQDELRSRAARVEREAAEGLHAVLVGEAAARLDEALHVHLGHRGEQHRMIGLRLGRHPQRHPFDHAAGMA
jgi:hypothetical protein